MRLTIPIIHWSVVTIIIIAIVLGAHRLSVEMVVTSSGDGSPGRCKMMESDLQVCVVT